MSKSNECTVCGKPKHTLRARKSKLNPAMPMLLCNECFEAKKEPRWLVILIARSPKHGGIAAVKDHIRNHRYNGDKILLEEIT